MQQCKQCELEWPSAHFVNSKGTVKPTCYRCRSLSAANAAWKTQGIEMSRKEYLFLQEAQNFRCRICEKQFPNWETDPTKRLSVDHSHSTGKTRGLLCQPCNLGLGLFKDNPEHLKAAIEYLAKY